MACSHCVRLSFAPLVEIPLARRRRFVHDGTALGQACVCLCHPQPLPCPMKRFYVVASIPLLLAALIPIAASLWVAHRKAKDDQINYLTSLADEVLRRGVARPVCAAPLRRDTHMAALTGGWSWHWQRSD